MCLYLHSTTLLQDEQLSYTGALGSAGPAVVYCDTLVTGTVSPTGFLTPAALDNPGTTCLTVMILMQMHLRI